MQKKIPGIVENVVTLKIFDNAEKHLLDFKTFLLFNAKLNIFSSFLSISINIRNMFG